MYISVFFQVELCSFATCEEGMTSEFESIQALLRSFYENYKTTIR